MATSSSSQTVWNAPLFSKRFSCAVIRSSLFIILSFPKRLLSFVCQGNFAISLDFFVFLIVCFVSLFFLFILLLVL
jgi:hypothetical protein